MEIIFILGGCKQTEPHQALTFGDPQGHPTGARRGRERTSERAGQEARLPWAGRGAWSRCTSLRTKLEGKEKADAAAKALQMSLAYQFVTPLTSMTIRGVADEDGLEPVVDKPPEGRARPGARGAALGAPVLRAFNSSLSLPSRCPALG